MNKFILIAVTIFMSGCAIQNPMVVSPMGDGTYWVLQEDLVYEVENTGNTIIVPKGFVTDFASVPRAFWSVFPSCGQYTSAAVIHDYLYWKQENGCSRKSVDKILKIAMEESDVGFLSRNVIYRAVRAGGSSSWNSNKKNKNKGAIKYIPEQFMKFDPNEKWEKLERKIINSGVPAKLPTQSGTPFIDFCNSL